MLDMQLNFDFNKHHVKEIPGLFDGSDIEPEHDNVRLSGQILRIFNLMKDGLWRTLLEIEASTGDSSASISAQLRNLRKARFGSHTVEKQRRGDRDSGLFEYKLTVNPQTTIDFKE